uniref:Uncharacterized protein n=1 Tax=Anopheles atroparvus TaxID=41427 RepID=A0A182JBD6_ANOAO
MRCIVLHDQRRSLLDNATAATAAAGGVGGCSRTGKVQHRRLLDAQGLWLLGQSRRRRYRWLLLLHDDRMMLVLLLLLLLLLLRLSLQEHRLLILSFASLREKPTHNDGGVRMVMYA